jgi:hypothetical protein
MMKRTGRDAHATPTLLDQAAQGIVAGAVARPALDRPPSLLHLLRAAFGTYRTF